MTRTRTMKLAAVAIIAGLLFWLVSGPKEEPSQTDDQNMMHTNNNGSSDHGLKVAFLSDEISRLRQDLSDLKASGVVESNGEPKAAHDADEAEHREATVFDEMSPGERDNAIETAFMNKLSEEKLDDSWAAPTEQAAIDIVGEMPTVSLVDVECRSTMCKMTLEHESNDDRQGVLQEMVGQEPFNTEGYINPHLDEEEPKTTMYFLRPGAVLPSNQELASLL